MGGTSNQVCVTYYPKVGVKEMFHSIKYRLLKASFHGTHVKVEMCGIDLIYAKDNGLNHPTMLRNPLRYFGDNGSSVGTTIHNVKGISDVAKQNSAGELPSKKLKTKH